MIPPNDTAMIRQPQHSGVFYPADAAILRQQLSHCLHRVGMNTPVAGQLRAIVVPHAAFVYSAHIAAHAYAALSGQDWIRRIVLLAPNHLTAMAGGLLCSHTQWLSPLGRVAIDQVFIQEHWAGLSHIGTDDAVHQAEYSIEVQLPFIQQVLPAVSIAPLLLGECTPQQIADMLAPVWDSADTLLVISSDLYHYLPRETALPAGRAIAQAIEQNQHALIGPETACGYVALRAVLQFAEKTDWYWRTLALGHSGEYQGIHTDGLVGYGAFLLIDPSVCRISS